MARKAGISLRTVAKATGVSIVTVSRVLNHDFLVDPQTAKRVKQAADELGYKLPTQERRSTRVSRGNISDRPLRTGRLAFILPDSTPSAFKTPLTRGLQTGIKEYLFEKKIECVSTYIENQQLPEILAKKEVDGYILRGNFSNIPIDEKGRAQMGRFPHVSLFGLSPLDQYAETGQIEDYVLPDDRLIGRLAFDALVKAGIEKPMLLSTLPDLSLPLAQISTLSRRNGFKYESLSRKLPHRLLEIPFYETSKIIAKLGSYIKRYGEPKGIFLTRAFPEMLEALKTLGLTNQQGTQVYCAIAGTEDRALEYGVHGIDLRPEALGRAAAELLLWRINHPEMESKSILIPPKMIKDS